MRDLLDFWLQPWLLSMHCSVWKKFRTLTLFWLLEQSHKARSNQVSTAFSLLSLETRARNALGWVTTIIRWTSTTGLIGKMLRTVMLVTFSQLLLMIKARPNTATQTISHRSLVACRSVAVALWLLSLKTLEISLPAVKSSSTTAPTRKMTEHGKPNRDYKTLNFVEFRKLVLLLLKIE